jgi:hypothetical protein
MPQMLTAVIVVLPFAGLVGPLVWMARSTGHYG